jgi:hypothetical protein
MTCDEARERMIFHVDGEDDEVGAHADRCAPCRANRDEVRRERALLRRAIQLEVAPPRRYVARSSKGAWAVFTAAAAALVAAIGWALSRRAAPPPLREQAPVVREKPREIPPKREPFEHPIPDPTPEKKSPRLPNPRGDRPSEEIVEEPKRETKVEERIEVALRLERGTSDWKGTRTFLAGESFRAKTALRVAWGKAAVYVKEDSEIKVLGRDAFAVEGAVLVENSGPPMRVESADAVVRDDGTRFAVDGGHVTVWDGRVRVGETEVVAGERASLRTRKVEPSKEPYPAWVAKAYARRSPVVAFPFSGGEKQTLYGTAKDGWLHGAEKEGLFYTGVESGEPFFPVPAKGEFWVTYFTKSPEPITLRCRAMKPESTAFNFEIRKPVTGRPVPVRVPLELFRSFDDRPLAAGDRVHILYIFTADAKSGLRIDDLAIMELRE